MFFYGFRRRHHPTFSYGFGRWFVYGFRRGRKHFFHGFRRWLSFYDFRRGRKTYFICMVSVAGLLVDSAAAEGSIILECIERFLVVIFVVFLGLASIAGCFLYGFPRGRKTFVYGFRRAHLYGFCRGKECFRFV